MFLMPTPAPYLQPSTITLVGSSESGNSSTVSFPETAEAGDVIIVMYGNRTSNPQIPTDFTLIEDVGSTNGGLTDTGTSVSYLIAEGGETQASGISTSLSPALVCAQYRFNVPVKTVTIASSSEYSGSGNPSNDTTLTASGNTKPNVALLSVFSSSTLTVDTRHVNFNGATGGTVERDVESSSSFTTLGYFLEADAGAGSDVVVNVGDTGVTATINALLEFS